MVFSLGLCLTCRPPLCFCRCKAVQVNPLWAALLVGGVNKDGTSFLGFVDKIGVAYTGNVMATGFGSYIAMVCLCVNVMTYVPMVSHVFREAYVRVVACACERPTRVCCRSCSQPWNPRCCSP